MNRYIVFIITLFTLHAQNQPVEESSPILELTTNTPLIEKIDAVERSFITIFGKENPLLSTTWPARIAIDIIMALHKEFEQRHKPRIELHIEMLQQQLERFEGWATLYIIQEQQQKPATESVKKMIEIAAALDAYIKEYLEEYIQQSRFYQEALQKNGRRDIATLILLPGLLSKGISLIVGLAAAFVGWRTFGRAPNRPEEQSIAKLERNYQDEVAKVEAAVRNAADAYSPQKRRYFGGTRKHSFAEAIDTLNRYAGTNHRPSDDTMTRWRRIRRFFTRRFS